MFFSASPMLMSIWFLWLFKMEQVELMAVYAESDTKNYLLTFLSKKLFWNVYWFYSNGLRQLSASLRVPCPGERTLAKPKVERWNKKFNLFQNTV